MKAGGISLYRIIFGIGAFMLVFTVGILIFNDRVVPRSQAKMRELFYEKIIKRGSRRTPRSKSRLYKMGANNVVWYINHYDFRRQKMRGITLLRYGPGNIIRKRWDAARAHWDNGRWLFQNVMVRHFSGKDGTVQKPEGVEYFSVLSIPFLKEKPPDFSAANKAKDEMTYEELKRLVKLYEIQGEDVQEDRTDMYLRIFEPMSNFIIFIIAIPFSVMAVRSGTAMSIGLCIATSFLYWGTTTLGKAFGHGGKLAPLLAANLGNIIWLAIGLFLFVRIRK